MTPAHRPTPPPPHKQPNRISSVSYRTPPIKCAPVGDGLLIENLVQNRVFRAIAREVLALIPPNDVIVNLYVAQRLHHVQLIRRVARVGARLDREWKTAEPRIKYVQEEAKRARATKKAAMPHERR